MGCLFAIVAALSPRLALVLVWLFTNLVDRAFEGFLLPLLGLVFLPFTTSGRTAAARAAAVASAKRLQDDRWNRGRAGGLA